MSYLVAGKTFRIPEVVADKKQKSRKRKKEPIVEEKPEINLEPIEDFIANTCKFNYSHYQYLMCKKW